MFDVKGRDIVLNWWIHHLIHELFQTEDRNGWSRAIPRCAVCLLLMVADVQLQLDLNMI